MAIKQLHFDRGEELGIRQKGNRLVESEVMENLKQNLEKEDVLIVKCGKSFWDVTAYPEIFEEGDEFRVEDLTATDRKQLEKAKKPEPAFKEAENPMSALFHRTDIEEKEEETEQLERKTYYLRPKDVEALTIIQHETRVQVSAIVREALERGLNSIADEIGYNELYAQAEINLSQKGFTGKKKSFKNITK